MQTKWQKITENLKNLLEPGIFQIWVAPLDAQITNNEVLVSAPNAYVCDWVKKRLNTAFMKAASEVLGLSAEKVNIIYKTRISGEKSASDSQNSMRLSHMPSGDVFQGYLPITPKKPEFASWHFSFDDFVVGGSNNMAVAAAKDLAASGTVRTLFLNAAPGLGKTHLVQATGNVISRSGPIKAAYITADQFASKYVASLREHNLESLKQFLCSLDALILEDVHFLQRKKAMQEMILSVVRHLQEKGARVIFTSSFAPREFQDVDSQLLSHFCSGILTGIEKPNMEMRQEILRRKAKSFQVNLPDEVCDIVSRKITSDIRQLESCLANMIFKARLLNSGLNLDLALETINNYASEGPDLDILSIVKLVCESFGITEKELYSKSRRHEYVAGRNTAYYLARKHTELSLEEIGCIFNRRHTTVMRGITQVEEEMAKESSQGRQFARAVALIEKRGGINSQTHP